MTQNSLGRLWLAVTLVVLFGLLQACAYPVPAQPAAGPPPDTPDIAQAVAATLTAIALAEPEATPTPPLPSATPVPAAESTPVGPAESAAILFRDDFEAGLQDAWQVVQGEWMTVNGWLIPVNELGGDIFVGDEAWTDYTVDVDLSSTAGRQYTALVLVRVQDRHNFVAFVADCNHGTWWEIVRDGEHEEVPGTRNDTWMCSTPYHLQVVAAGSTYQAFVDNELQSRFTRDLWAAGRVGLRSIDEGSLAAFDNLQVSR